MPDARELARVALKSFEDAFKARFKEPKEFYAQHDELRRDVEWLLKRIGREAKPHEAHEVDERIERAVRATTAVRKIREPRKFQEASSPVLWLIALAVLVFGFLVARDYLSPKREGARRPRVYEELR